MLLKRLTIVFLCGTLIGPADARGRRPALMGNSIPIWVKSGATVDMSFATGQYYGCTLASCLSITRASSKTNLLPSSASGFSYTTFSNNILAITPGSGLLIEEARTNQLLNSAAPATQTTGSLGTGTYTLWVNGSGSATMSLGTGVGCGTGTATNGTPVNFTITVAGTCIVTVIGSLNFEQLELGAFGTSGIVTAGATATRAADNITPVAPLATIFNGSALSVVVATNGLPSSTFGFSRVLGNNSNGAMITTGGASSMASYNGVTQLFGTCGTGGPAGLAKTGAAQTPATSRSVVCNNGTVGTDSNSTTTTQAFIGSQSGTSNFLDGYMSRLTAWNSRLPDATLKANTQ
jgi:hypothetical protein